MTYEPGTYVKGNVEREAKNAKQAVALVFEGFKPKPKTETKTEDVKPAATVTETPEESTPESVTASSDDTPSPAVVAKAARNNR